MKNLTVCASNLTTYMIKWQKGRARCGPKPLGQTRRDPQYGGYMAMEAFDLKRGMLLGAANGGVRSDGGTPGHTWGDWCARGMLRGADPARAAAHWDRWREDVTLMRRMGLECCRFTVDWSRLEPEQDVFDDAAIAHVREELLLMRAVGIRPVLVLHEFTDPLWFGKLGGWTKVDNIRCFLAYVEKLVRTVGHLVSDYVTISQPNLFAKNGWYLGAWPPGKTSLYSARHVMSVLAAAHIECYQRLHAVRRELGFQDTRVGASAYMRMIRPRSGKHPLYVTLGANTVDKQFQTAMSEAMVLGKFSTTVRNLRHLKKGVYCDFHDLCCYALPGDLEGLPGAGREISADELLYCAAKRCNLLRRPLFITEGSGLSAPSPQRIYDIVSTISRAALPVECYFSMAFTDGFEWGQGESAHLGLVALDPETGDRSIRPGGEFYARVIRNRGVTEEMCRQYTEA